MMIRIGNPHSYHTILTIIIIMMDINKWKVQTFQKSSIPRVKWNHGKHPPLTNNTKLNDRIPGVQEVIPLRAQPNLDLLPFVGPLPLVDGVEYHDTSHPDLPIRHLVYQKKVWHDSKRSVEPCHHLESAMKESLRK